MKPELKLIKGGKYAPQLYKIETIVPYYTLRGAIYESVPILWFVTDRPHPVAPYENLIDRYEILVDKLERETVQECADECFTKEEADAVLAYLRRVHPDEEHTVKEEKTPLSARPTVAELLANGGPYTTAEEIEKHMPMEWGSMHGIPWGDGIYRCVLCDQPNPDLPQTIEGLMYLEGCPYTIDPDKYEAPPGEPPWAVKIGNMIIH